ncbi:MAG: iron-sulfur cluster assembly protein HesB [Paenibacillus sp.]|jgi:3-hexulose-6-phosphate synthase|nr:iron-sulfur cluster assembly protein HesB [Paenibacillus sp.]
MAKLQLALDRLERREALRLVERLQDQIDWIEIGTGMIKEYGMGIIAEMKSLYPSKTLVADMKTCDAGAHETTQAFNAGADISTVMGFAFDGTIIESLQVAASRGKRIMIDALNIREIDRLDEIASLGAGLICLHNGKDMQHSSFVDYSSMLERLRRFPEIKTAVAGGITPDTLEGILKQGPEVVVVGAAITGAANPKKAALRFKELMRNVETNT